MNISNMDDSGEAKCFCHGGEDCSCPEKVCENCVDLDLQEFAEKIGQECECGSNIADFQENKMEPISEERAYEIFKMLAESYRAK